MFQAGYDFSGACSPVKVKIPMPGEQSLEGIRNIHYLRDVPTLKVTCQNYLQSAFSSISNVQAPKSIFRKLFTSPDVGFLTPSIIKGILLSD
jgi:hypothetical protein